MTIKICGITRREDADAAAALGVNALGFVFWPGSPRAITPAAARSLIRSLPPFVVAVGVFVDPDAALLDACAESGIHVAQIVGRVPALPRGLKLLRVATLDDRGSMVPSVAEGEPVLLDTHDPIRRGGTGRPLDWAAVAGVARGRSVVLAGGLRADNVADAIRLARPDGVDVSSGVEDRPGVKDHAKMSAFVAAVRAVA